jgi:hypothetical protein
MLTHVAFFPTAHVDAVETDMKPSQWIGTHSALRQRQLEEKKRESQALDDSKQIGLPRCGIVSWLSSLSLISTIARHSSPKLDN